MTTPSFEPKLTDETVKAVLVTNLRCQIAALENENDNLTGHVLTDMVAEAGLYCLVDYLVAQGASIEGFALTTEKLVGKLVEQGVDSAVAKEIVNEVDISFDPTGIPANRIQIYLVLPTDTDTGLI